MTTSSTLHLLQKSPSQVDLLLTLKDLKNVVIGNTWKKVEVAEDEELLSFLLSLLHIPGGSVDNVTVEVISETAVILGALANVGSLTLRPLLSNSTAAHLLGLIKSLSNAPLDPRFDRLIPPLLRALRNLLVSTADLAWGHMWGVGAERKVVGTGLVGEDTLREAEGKREGVPRGRRWRVEASRALALVFEPSNLNTLLSLLTLHPTSHTLLPLYQLFARLVALPSHREALAKWTPSTPAPSVPAIHLENDWFHAGPSILKLADDSGPLSSSSKSKQAVPEAPFILDHLLSTTTLSSPEFLGSISLGRKQNPKLLEAALDLLAALVKGQPTLAVIVRSWNVVSREEGLEVSVDEDEKDRSSFPEFVGLSVDMLLSGPTAVRIAAASCLTNIIKADKGSRTYERVRSTVLNLQLLDVIVKLLRSEGLEDRVKLCFVLAALVSDDSHLQKTAAEQGCPAQLVNMMVEIGEDEKGELGNDLASRSVEAALIALASLAFQHEPTRSFLAETTPACLPYLNRALSHPSYGVRAAACQLARALSRTVAILRTSLVDSGVGEEVVEVLRREVEARRLRACEDDEDDLGERAWTVEVAATATICNLIADFSPLKATLLRTGGIELLCELTHSPYEPLARNSLWALKNLTFHALDAMKGQVMAVLGWNTLRIFIGPATPLVLRVQALEIMQNLLADAPALELARYVESFGESYLLDTLAFASREGSDPELRVPALWVLSNLALGNEKTRSTIVNRIELVEALSEAINAKVDPVKVPALRCIRHLVESNAKTHRPRQAIVDLLHPYQLKPRLRELAEQSPSLDVCQAAVGLLDVLDRSRETGSIGSVGSR